MWAAGRGAGVGVQRRVAEMRKPGLRNNHKARHSQEGVGARGACGRPRPRSTSHLPAACKPLTRELITAPSLEREKNPKTLKNLPEQLIAS